MNQLRINVTSTNCDANTITLSLFIPIGTPTLDISDVIFGDKDDGQDQVKNISTKGVTEV